MLRKNTQSSFYLEGEGSYFLSLIKYEEERKLNSLLKINTDTNQH